MPTYSKGNKVRIDEKCLQQYQESSDQAIIEGAYSDLNTDDYKNKDAVYRIMILNKLGKGFAKYQWIEEVHLTLLESTTAPGIALLDEYDTALTAQGSNGL